MAETKSEWFIIVNPHAGSGKTISEWSVAQKYLDSTGSAYRAVLTNHKSHATALAFSAAAEGYRRIMAVGGDGTFHEIYSGILRWCTESGTDPREFCAGVFPIGSGNDWIKSVGIPHDHKQVCDLMLSESFREQDVIGVSCSDGTTYMANIGGIGFDSRVCEWVNRLKEAGRRSKLIYLNALLYTIRGMKSMNVQILADGEEVFTGECLSVALGNGRYSGGGMLQVPIARIDDGLLDVMIVPKQKIGSILKCLPKLFSGDLNESPQVRYLRCKHFQMLPLDSASTEIFEVDGEIEGRLPISVDVTGERINVLATPQKA